ncbi:hypothetical protein IMG5_068750 [Ichthyophthirius multifiliis]|uniref:Flap endonuclease 1 n=1 Tax=Ichthyophthirius multifiliis TaxID=5932 RepID=G0QPK1_ICHMU|nr:hypothetical protein IMG5_068750 [Ichthyophthirius multifiliis]EGR32852.1 hypothetical protein IMG5_068750 [Ichthyophthirius multifiliis]|eukprot:XP_004036838.1 hypothetical protein IMG5_068750 [Ichthyophthirius multifiliis]
MGIHKLMDLLREKAPKCIKTADLKFYGGRQVACDASMAMYQFLATTSSSSDFQIYNLTDKDGNKTAHLVGLFNRTVMLIDSGIKPAWIFDGKPPEFKSGELTKRQKAKANALEKQKAALDIGDMEEALKMEQRNLFITKDMKNDAIKMLQLLGVPVIQAPCEAEAQCAALTKAKKVFATVTEDMDALTFGTPTLLRGLNSKKEPIIEIDYNLMLQELELTQEQFVDLCILCGCDYLVRIDGIGPITAYKLIKEHLTLENVIAYMEKANDENSKKQKFKIPSEYNYVGARDLFFNPVIEDPEKMELKWTKPDIEGLKQFLVQEKGFNEDRVMNQVRQENQKLIKKKKFL